MHILYVCHYFPPEPGAPSARGMETVQAWKAAGHDVSVVTCFPNHPTGVVPESYRGRRYMREVVDGVTVHRVWTYATPNKGFVKKTLSHLFFTIMAVLQGLGRVTRPDVVVTSSPTLFSGLAGWFMSRWFKVPFVFEVRDLWPAAIVALGMLKEGSLPVRLLEKLEMFLYRRAARVVVVTHAFKDALVARGLPADKVVVITNGVDPQRYIPMPIQTDFRAELGLKDEFVVQYAGAHGVSHALHVLIDVAKVMPDVHFLFVGDGAAKDDLIHRVQSQALTNVTFVPSQPKQRMPEVYATADVCLVPLRNIQLFETFIPSKMFEIMASGRPIVASVAGEAANILRDSGGAIVVPPEDSDGIAAAIRSLQRDATLRAELGAKGRAFVMEHYDRKQLARRYLAVLEQACAQEALR